MKYVLKREKEQRTQTRHQGKKYTQRQNDQKGMNIKTGKNNKL